MNDKIKPDYYGKLDVITFCTENNIPFCEGNIIKYVVRYAKKNGLEDLLKAREYLDRLIKRIECYDTATVYENEVKLVAEFVARQNAEYNSLTHQLGELIK